MPPTLDRTKGGCMTGRWVDLREAAELLDASTEAVRKRAARGSLRSDRQNGRVLVWVDEGRTEGGREAEVEGSALLAAKDETIAILQEQLREEREARRRADTLLARFMDQLPALEPSQEASQEPSEPSQGAAEGQVVHGHANADPGSYSASSQRRPWWRFWS